MDAIPLTGHSENSFDEYHNKNIVDFHKTIFLQYKLKKDLPSYFAETLGHNYCNELLMALGLTASYLEKQSQ